MRTARRPLTVLVLAPHFAPGSKAGGAQRSITALVDVAPPGIEVLVVTRDRDLGDAEAYPDLSGRAVGHGRGRVFYVDPRNALHLLRMIRTVRAFAPRVVYLNSLWDPIFGLMPMAITSTGMGTPRLVVAAPRGQLQHGARTLGRSRLKSAALRLWRHWSRRPGHAFHCSDPGERSTVQRLVPGARCLVSLDPVQLPPHAAPWTPRPRGHTLELVHLSRVTRKKGLDFLLLALALVKHAVHLSVVGPLEDPEFATQLRHAAARLPGHVTVDFCGPADPSTVRHHFAAADLFAFPTLGESFGHVIPEALSASCPVLCGPDTPFIDVLRAGGGEVLAVDDPQAWARAIDRWAALSPDEMAQEHRRAGDAYGRWYNTRDRSHVFDLFRDLLME